MVGALATAVLLAAVFTLSERSRRAAARREQAPAVSAAADRFWEGEPDGIPRLLVPASPESQLDAKSPPEAVPDLSQAHSATPILAAGPSEADQVLRRARTSRPVVFEGHEPQGERPPRAQRSLPASPPVSADPAAALQAASSLASSLSREEDPVVAQNLQREKEAFLRGSALAREDEVLAARVRPPLSPYEVMAGALLPAVLITQANSDLPGQLIAQIRENVYDTATGGHLLIPQGTRAIGVYDSLVAFGQERVLVAWQRLIFPDGSSLNLGSMPGTDPAGAAGFHDRVDHGYLRTYGSAVLLSVISAGAQLSQGTFGSGRGAEERQDVREILAAALGQNLGELATESTERNLNVQPTLEIRSGYRFHIAVMKDLVLPGPYAAF